LSRSAWLRGAVSWGWIVLLLAGTQAAQALGLGASELRSSLGQPLNLRIALTAAASEDVGCVTVKGRGDLNPPVGLHFEVLSDARGQYIAVTSAKSVDDPAIALVVAAGCTSPVSREYVLFLDPAALAPAAASAPVTPVLPVTAAPTGASAPAATSAPSRGAPRESAGNALARGRTAAASDEAPSVPAAPLPKPPSKTSPKLSSNAGPKRSTPPAPGPSRASKGSPTPAAPAAQAAGQPPASPAADAGAGRGDRLHLSRALDSPDLRISSELSPSEGAPPDAERLAELRAEQVRLMALLNGQSPDSTPGPREEALQKHVDELGGDIAKLRTQVKEAQDRSQLLEASRGLSWLPWLLGACAFLGLGLAAWFGWRYRTVQESTATHPWWEQSQLAAAGRGARRGGGAIPFGDSRPDDEEDTLNGFTSPKPAAGPGRPPKARPQQIAGAAPGTGGTRAPAAPPAPARSSSSPPSSSPARSAPPASPPAAPARPAAPSPVAAPAAMKPPIPAAPRVPLDRPASGPKALPFGAVSSIVGSLDERVDSTELTRSAIDFNLDLPEIITSPLVPAAQGASKAASAEGPRPPAVPSGAGISPQAAEAFNLQPLDFELPSKKPPTPTASEAPAPTLGPDTILRLDENVPSAEAPAATAPTGEHASLQFRLLQFATVVEQASELQANNEPTKAIAVLRQYVLRDENIPTLMWLMLFELYKVVNKRPVYEALAEHFTRRYKRPMIRWEETLDQKTAQLGLASVPDIERQLKARWGTQAGLELLRGLTCDRDRADAITFNAVLQRDLLAQAKIFPIEDTN
jgi:hypothetical protein